MTPIDARQYAPATARNREPILNFFRQWLASTSYILEIASGTGEHGLFFSEQWTEILWQPSDVNPRAIASIKAWQELQGNERFLSPLKLDMQLDHWWDHPGLRSHDDVTHAIVNINMLHISPWESAEGLFHGAEKLLRSQDFLYFYGPFKRAGEHTSTSNHAFDQSLRSRDASWGVRDLEAVIALAQDHRFALQCVEPMPANNFSVLFEKI